MKIVTVVGVRPQFIKAAMLSKAIRIQNNCSQTFHIEDIIVHTGQHYDDNMSEVFFDELDIPRPRYNLGVSGGLHGAMTGRMLEGIESVLIEETPDWVLVYGDTNSTLAGALAAVKINIPIIHVEAGLRSFDMRAPEEINRVLTDRISNVLFCPTNTAMENLLKEGARANMYNVGDVMLDSALFYGDLSKTRSSILDDLDIEEKSYTLFTLHRAENTDSSTRLNSILKGLSMIAENTTVVFPLHPRTKKAIEECKLAGYLKKMRVIPPVSFLDMIRLEQSAEAILTDSGGVQKEAYFFRTPCITLRNETEWVETIQACKNILAGFESYRIVDLYQKTTQEKTGSDKWPDYFGDGSAAAKIIAHFGLRYCSDTNDSHLI